MSQEEFVDLQRAIDDRGHLWSAGPTSLSGLSPEQQAYRLGLRVDPEEMRRIARQMARRPARAAQFPPAWDWRDVEGADWTTPVRDQRACGSCVAFGTVAVIEAMLKRYQGNAGFHPDLSEAHLFFCGCGSCCDTGWWPTYALDYAQRHGVPDEACFRYQDRYLPCADSCDGWESRVVKVSSWREVLDAGARKEWLASKGPVVGCMAVYRDLFSYRQGVYRHTNGELAGYHAVCVVGYSESERAWICKNSWGNDWGDAGWFKIGYGECGMDTAFPMYGVAAVEPPSPEPPPPPSPDPPSPPEPPPEPGCNLWAQVIAAFRRLTQ